MPNNSALSFKDEFRAVIAFWTITCVCLSGWGAPAQGINPSPLFRTDRIIIKLKEGQLHSGLLSKKRGKTGHRVLKKLLQQDSSLQLVSVGPGETVAQAIEAYRKTGLIEFAEPDYKVRAAALPNDPHFTSGVLWRLNNYGQNAGKAGADISAVKAWDNIHDASQVVVAVLDSGIRYTHEDLAENMWVNPGELPGNGVDDDANGLVDDIHGINAVADNGDPMDDLGHGTHVAGIIGAAGNNAIGVTGVAWKVRLMACKLLDKEGNGDISDAIQAVDYARKHGARIMNASWGGPGPAEGLELAIRHARNAGIIFVTSAGNSSSDNDLSPVYPPNFDLDNIVVVCATSRNDSFNGSFSNFGKSSVDLAAPGSAMYSTWFINDRSYSYLSGTSMAAPVVSGAFALLKARYPQDNEIQLIRRMYETADRLPSLQDKCVTGGRLNLEKALQPILRAEFTLSGRFGEPGTTITFTDQSFGEIANWSWNFGDGSNPVGERNPPHTYTSAGEYVARLTISSALGITASKEQKIVIAENYSIHPVGFEWIQPEQIDSSFITLQLEDDGLSAPIQIPFDFEFYGVKQTSLFVSANGLLGFSPEGLNKAQPDDLPGAGVPSNFIAPCWQDLNPVEGGAVSVLNLGAAPHRRLVISWIGVISKISGSLLSFQAVLEESTQKIQFNYLEAGGEILEEGGKNAAIGIEHPSGILAAKYSYFGLPATLLNQSSVQFRPKPRISFIAEVREDLLFIRPGNTKAFSGPKTIGLRNTGNTAVPWNSSRGSDYFTIHPAEGVLQAGDTLELSVQPSLRAIFLEPGDYWSLVTITNLLDHSQSLAEFAKFNVIGTPMLTVRGPVDWMPEGKPGGPFVPARQTFILENTGNAALNWKVTYDSSLFAISNPTGVLEPGASAQIVVTLGDGVALLGAGLYSTQLFFRNMANRLGNLSVNVSMKIHDGLNPNSVSGLNEQSFVFQVTGAPGSQYSVEKSEDLVHWEFVEIIRASQDKTVRVTVLNDGSLQSCFFSLRASAPTAGDDRP